MFWLILILLIILVYLVFAVTQFINVTFKNYPPLIRTGREAIREIIRAIPDVNALNRAGAVVYELGCGRAPFLRLMGPAYPKAKLIGVENLAILCLLNRLLFKLQGKRIKILRQDLLTLDLSSADLIYCYLNNTTMTRLSEKFKRECRPGTQIISRRFLLPDWMPVAVKEIKNKKVYFYIVN